MKTISTNNSKALSFDKFEGIDKRRDKKDRDGSSHIENFRILKDGSLKKRCGYKLLTDLGGTPRAIWTGKLGGTFKCYVLIGSTVSSLNLSTGVLNTIGTVSTRSGGADFFYYRGSLYLIDGASLKTVTDSSLLSPSGYVPLVGKDWRDTYIGEPYEPRNLLNRRGRISYVISEEPSTFLKTDAPISSVDAVYINGTKLASSQYEMTELARTISVNGMLPGDRVMVYFTYASAPYSTAELFSNTRAIVFGGITNSRPFLWGGGKSSAMYSSAYVTETALAESRRVYTTSDALYFPAGYEFTVGDGRFAISTVSRHYDRLLIFTEGGTWMADSSSCGFEDFPAMSINSSIGVSSKSGAAMLGNDPYTVGEHSIYRWTANTDELDECNAYSISGAIDSLLPDGFFADACVFADNKRGELLFCSQTLGDTVPVYSLAGANWLFFKGISADRFIDCGGDVGFLSGSRLYVFDEQLESDEGGREIVGHFESNLSDISAKRASHLSSLDVAYEGDGIEIGIRLDEEDSPSVVLPLESATGYTRVRKRLSAKRFSRLRISASASGGARQTIYSLTLGLR